MEKPTVYAKSNAAEAESKMVINDFAPVPVAPLSSYHDFLHIQVSGQPNPVSLEYLRVLIDIGWYRTTLVLTGVKQ